MCINQYEYLWALFQLSKNKYFINSNWNNNLSVINRRFEFEDLILVLGVCFHIFISRINGNKQSRIIIIIISQFWYLLYIYQYMIRHSVVYMVRIVCWLPSSGYWFNLWDNSPRVYFRARGFGNAVVGKYYKQYLEAVQLMIQSITGVIF